MRLFTILALIAIGTGAGLIGFSLCIPVYTDAEAPFRLSQELQSLPRELRFKEWDKQLPRYETAHKKLFDWGQGILGIGLGGGAMLLILAGYDKYPRIRRKTTLAAIWIFAWACSAAGMFWSFVYRLRRFEYPTWGDSIGIPLYQSAVTIAFGTTVTTLLLLILFWKMVLPENATPQKPSFWILWVRALFIGVWSLLLLFIVVMRFRTETSELSSAAL